MIPNKIHFIFLSKENKHKSFGITHYLAIESAFICNPGFSIDLYCDQEPTGEWWDIVKSKEYVKLNIIQPPTEIFGNPVKHPAHQADVLRLEILKKVGGIYLDIDTITVKSYNDLLIHKCVIGYEGKRELGIGNAVILAEPNNKFIADWYEEYKTFSATGLKDDTWNIHSIKLPLKMWESGAYNDHLTILPYDAFHYPTWSKTGSIKLFEEAHEYPNAYCHHIWESTNKKYIDTLTEVNIKNIDTTYNIIARRYL